MHTLKISSEIIDTEINVVVIGQLAGELPTVVQQEVTAIENDKKRLNSMILVTEGRYLILKAEEKAWLENNGEKWRLLGSQIPSSLRLQNLTSATVILPNKSEIAQSIAEGVILGDYQFTDCRSGDAAERNELTVSFPGFDKEVEQAEIIASAQNFARNLGDMPPNQMNPETFVTRAIEEFDSFSNITLNAIIGTEELLAERFPGLVQVGKSGSTEPALLEIHYKPETKKTDKKLALVGKGLTFDAGGISLKPAAGMWQMKGDMCGATAVIGAMKIIAAQKPEVEVTAYIALAENLPDSNAQRPGDIYQARNGKFIHVDNTDAEGRLVLSDVLTYACEKGATHIVDAATLTGAVLMGLGTSIAGVMSNDDDWAQTIRSTGQKTGEEWWQLPLFGEYRAQLDHPHADLNNTGGRNAGTITAGIFLSEFVTEGVIWAHCDVAGTAMRCDSAWRYYKKGMTGFAVRTFADLPNQLID